MNNEKTEEQFRLCYVDGPWAYFTTQKLSEQWGDDWGDRPYEHNAGEPYTYLDHDRKEGREPWKILKVAFDGSFEAPCDKFGNSPYSVQDINSSAVAWLIAHPWEKDPVVIIAGTTLEEFTKLIEQGGGKVYSPDPITLDLTDTNDALLALKGLLEFASHPEIQKHIDGSMDPDIFIYKAKKVLNKNWPGWDVDELAVEA